MYVYVPPLASVKFRSCVRPMSNLEICDTVKKPMEFMQQVWTAGILISNHLGRTLFILSIPSSRIKTLGAFRAFFFQILVSHIIHFFTSAIQEKTALIPCLKSNPPNNPLLNPFRMQKIPPDITSHVAKIKGWPSQGRAPTHPSELTLWWPYPCLEFLWSRTQTPYGVCQWVGCTFSGLPGVFLQYDILEGTWLTWKW